MRRTRSPSPTAPEPTTATDPVHVSFLLDRSGSMSPLAPAVVDGFNAFLAEQQARPGKARLTLAQFDDQAPFEVLVDATKLAKVTPLAPGDFEPRGMTPLYDALAALLDRAEARVAARAKLGKPVEDQLVVVFTDGLENASRHATRDDVFQRIAAAKEHGWTFVFLGANQDSYESGEGLAFDAGSTSNYHADARGMLQAFRSVSRATSSYRAKPRSLRFEDSSEFFEGVKEAETDR